MRSKQSAKPAIILLLVLLMPLLSIQSASAQGLDWSQVSTHGFGSTENWWVDSLSVFGDYLYAGTWNPLGAEIWRSSDGTAWFPVAGSGLGDAHNQGVVAACAFNGALYVGLYNTDSGASIWRSTDGLNWVPVQDKGFGDAANGAVLSMAVFEEVLYVGTWNFSQGAQVWRTSTGTQWAQANASGFGDPNNEHIQAMATFEGALYVGTYNQATGAQIWRNTESDDWKQIVSDGFANASNLEICSMAIHRGILYAGTRNDADGSELWRTRDGLNWIKVDSWPVALGPASIVVYEGSLFAGATGEGGTEIWSSSDGVLWVRSSEPGFGNTANKGSLAVLSINQYLYVATSNPTRGAGLYRSAGYGASITMTAGSDSLCAGEEQSYDITLRNSGQRALTRITLTDKLPGAVEFLPGASSPGANQNTATGSVTWEVGTLLPGESISLHIQARVSTAVLDNTPITNRITAKAQELAPKEVLVSTRLVQCAESSTASEETPVPTDTSEPAMQATSILAIGLSGPSPEIVNASDSGTSLDRADRNNPLHLPIILKPFPSA